MVLGFFNQLYFLLLAETGALISCRNVPRPVCGELAVPDVDFRFARFVIELLVAYIFDFSNDFLCVRLSWLHCVFCFLVSQRPSILVPGGDL